MSRRRRNPSVPGPEHQGWANMETWCIALWLDNERALYYKSRAIAQEGMRHGNNVRWIGHGLSDLIDDAMLDKAHFTVDLANAALNRVDWDEIADAIRTEILEGRVRR